MILLSALDFFLKMKAKADWQDKPKKVGRLHLGYVKNYGVFNGFLNDKPKNVLTFQMIMVTICLAYTFYVVMARKNTVKQIGWLLISLGGLNNFIDRVLNGFVTDYLSLNKKMYFNIADIFVFSGASFAFLADLYETMREKPEIQKEEI